MPLGVARAALTRALGAQAEWLPTDLPSLVGWYSATRSTFSLTGAAVNQWGNAGPATPDLVTGISPTKSTDGSGIAFVQFDGANDFLTFATTVASLIGANVFSILCAVKIRSNAGGAADTWNNPAIIADASNYVGMYITNSASPFTVKAYVWDGAEKSTAAQSVTANTLSVLQMWHTGSALNIQLNENSPASLAAGNVEVTTGDVRVGIQGTLAVEAAIDLYDLVVTNAVISAGDITNYYDFVQAEYVAAAAYTSNPVNFDGTNDYLTRGGALTGLSDGLVVLFSAWFRVTGTGTERRIFTIRSGTSTRLTFAARTNNAIYVFARNSAGTTVLEADGPVITDTAWHHLLISCNLANVAQRAFLIDGVTASPTWSTYTNSSIDLAPTTPVITIGAAAAAESLWNGDLADLYFATPATWFDPASGGNLAKFISAGAPVDLGADGSTPLGAAPIVFLSGPTVDWHTNKGTGGGFTEVGALTNGTSPVAL